MKKNLIFCFLVLSLLNTGFSQTVGIGTNTPHPSAVLDVVSNSKGLSIPSVTTAQRLAIANPKAGLFVFDTTMQTLCMFNGSNWVYFQSSVMPNVVHPTEKTASDGQVGDQFGFSVDISGNYAVIGAPYDDEGAVFNKGCAYIFFFNGTAWTEQAKITASNGEAQDNFGFSVSIDGDYVIIGAPNRDVGASADRGAAYIFIRSGASWSQQSILPAIGLQAGDNFGYSVSINGNYCIAGAPDDDVGANTDQGTAFFFVRSGASWSQQDYVTLPSGAADDNFGHSVDIAGNYAIVGAPYDDAGGWNNNGSVHLFERIVNAWSHMQTIAPIVANNTHFGRTVSVDSIFAAVGRVDNVSVYKFNGTIWVSDGFPPLIYFNENFGYSVSLSGTYIHVGAPAHSGIANGSGISHLFQTDGTGGWYLIRDMADPIGGFAHYLGRSVAVSGFNSISGAPEANGSKGKVLFINVQ
jgi:FG-GAP repeat